MLVDGLDFERPIKELEKRIEELRNFTSDKNLKIDSEIKGLEERLVAVRKEVYSSLTPWQRVQLGRHHQRPTIMDYIERMVEDFVALHGDRHFGDDKALLTGLGRISGIRVAIIGHWKGKNTRENIEHNFGMAHPEGYRKALRIMRLAERFGMAVLCFVDTPGAYPGVEAEARGQALAIAENLQEMAGLRCPIVVTITGEGGSGGALAIGVGDRLLMLENTIYSVISPEGCAAILWNTREKAADAANILKLTSFELKAMGIVDNIVEEPLGGAHTDPQGMAQRLKEHLIETLEELSNIPIDDLLEQRYQRYRRIGEFIEV